MLAYAKHINILDSSFRLTSIIGSNKYYDTKKRIFIIGTILPELALRYVQINRVSLYRVEYSYIWYLFVD